MPRKVSLISRTEQPMNWKRAFLAGMFAASLMMAFVDIANMAGITRFSFENYLGAIFYHGDIYAVHSWTIGLIANWIVGGVFGFLYAYFFEYVFFKANVRVGIYLGFAHTIVAAVAVFPFVNAVYEQWGLKQPFGILGSALDAPTPIVLLLGHLCFGALMGVFYGSVRRERIHDRFAEPGECVPIDAHVAKGELISPDEDHSENIIVNW